MESNREKTPEKPILVLTKKVKKLPGEHISIVIVARAKVQIKIDDLDYATWKAANLKGFRTKLFLWFIPIIQKIDRNRIKIGFYTYTILDRGVYYDICIAEEQLEFESA